MGPLKIEDAVALGGRWAKDNVTADVNRGVPLKTGTFSELGRVRPFRWRTKYPRLYLQFWIAVRNEVAAWIEAGMPQE
jgi:hypothetical protein